MSESTKAHQSCRNASTRNKKLTVVRNSGTKQTIKKADDYECCIKKTEHNTRPWQNEIVEKSYKIRSADPPKRKYLQVIYLNKKARQTIGLITIRVRPITTRTIVSETRCKQTLNIEVSPQSFGFKQRKFSVTVSARQGLLSQEDMGKLVSRPALEAMKALGKDAGGKFDRLRIEKVRDNETKRKVGEDGKASFVQSRKTTNMQPEKMSNEKMHNNDEKCKKTRGLKNGSADIQENSKCELNKMKRLAATDRKMQTLTKTISDITLHNRREPKCNAHNGLQKSQNVCFKNHVGQENDRLHMVAMWLKLDRKSCNSDGLRTRIANSNNPDSVKLGIHHIQKCVTGTTNNHSKNRPEVPKSRKNLVENTKERDYIRKNTDVSMSPITCTNKHYKNEKYIIRPTKYMMALVDQTYRTIKASHCGNRNIKIITSQGSITSHKSSKYLLQITVQRSRESIDKICSIENDARTRFYKNSKGNSNECAKKRTDRGCHANINNVLINSNRYKGLDVDLRFKRVPHLTPTRKKNEIRRHMKEQKMMEAARRGINPTKMKHVGIKIKAMISVKNDVEITITYANRCFQTTSNGNLVERCKCNVAENNLKDKKVPLRSEIQCKIKFPRECSIKKLTDKTCSRISESKNMTTKSQQYSNKQEKPQCKIRDKGLNNTKDEKVLPWQKSKIRHKTGELDKMIVHNPPHCDESDTVC